MIDIDELRFSAANSVKDLALLPSEVLELIDRLEAAESTRRDDYQNWMTALDRNAEMLAKLEAAEKERDDVAQQLVQSEIGKREISEAHDALQVEVGKLKDLEVSRCVKINGYIVDNARLVEEVERLRAELSKQALTDAAQHIAEVAQSRANQLQAKITEMERQEPVGEVVAFGESLHEVSWNRGKLPPLGAKLCLLPGAQGEKK